MAALLSVPSRSIPFFQFSMSSLLKFQIGPVQDFIAAARSTRDLWSGSYLLSWLVAAGIKARPAERHWTAWSDGDGLPSLHRSSGIGSQFAVRGFLAGFLWM